MTRTDLIELCLHAVKAKAYLEVGVSKGATFLAVKCDRKVAVDPEFVFNWELEAQNDPTANFFQVTSDQFFYENAATQGHFDVIFLDGLHTSEQILRDFTNALRYLSRDGVIVIDDVVPDSYYSSLRDQSLANRLKVGLGLKDKSWMGDVYKVVPIIETFFQQYSYALPLEIPKCLVVWPQARPPSAVTHRTISDVARFEFENTVLSPGFYNRLPLADIMKQIMIQPNTTSAAPDASA